MKKIIFFILVILMVGCESAQTQKLRIDDTTYRSIGKNKRIKQIVLHYTATNDEIGIKTLTTQKVSSHYLITSKDEDPVYNLVPLIDRAWHAGVSEFNGIKNLNDTSIGIEITNYGVRDYKEACKKYGFFIPDEYYLGYSEGQYKKIVELLKYLIKEFDIEPKNILGHSDIAPSRKIDPGTKFPWKRLYYEHNIGAWYDETDKSFFMNEEVYSNTSICKIKDELRKYGYAINETDEWDEPSRRVVYAFQCHFNPKKATGNMDLESFAILKALNKKYK